jgi:hypothetical protein
LIASRSTLIVAPCVSVAGLDFVVYCNLDLVARGAWSQGGLERMRALRFAERLVDEHPLAETLQGLELLFGLEHEALEHEGRIGPRAIELGDVHAVAQLAHRDAFLRHSNPLGPLR